MSTRTRGALVIAVSIVAIVESWIEVGLVSDLAPHALAASALVLTVLTCAAIASVVRRGVHARELLGATALDTIAHHVLAWSVLHAVAERPLPAPRSADLGWLLMCPFELLGAVIAAVGSGVALVTGALHAAAIVALMSQLAAGKADRARSGKKKKKKRKNEREKAPDDDPSARAGDG